MSAKKVWIIIYLQVYVNNIEQGEIQHDGNVQVPSVTVDYDKTLGLVSVISILKILLEVQSIIFVLLLTWEGCHIRL